ncbi:RTA1 domain-containing protein [Stipitochalara longipes BDJ]|nr:RTA1 domain-containing protein [Stipitochalara longipes BDJ]
MTTNYITIPGVTNDHVTLAPQTISVAIPTCIQTITPDKNGYVPPGTCNALYDYYPSFAAALVFSVLFGILTIAHISQAALFKTKFCWVIIMASIWETISFTARTISTRNQQNAWIELISELFVLLAPLWVNAFAYMLLARMVHFYLPTHSIFSIPASVLAIAFVTLDFVSFVIQIVGGSYAGPTAPMAQQLKGVHIYMGGIGLQQFFIFIFLGLGVKFHREMLLLERMGSAKDGWKRLLFTLYGSLGFITIRIFFRLIEFSGGKTSSNPLPYHEIYFYALEAVPMCFAILCYNITHPGTILQGPEAHLPTIRSLVFKKKGGRTPQEVGNGAKMISKYAELREESVGIHVELEGKDPREGRRSFREKFGLW